MKTFNELHFLRHNHQLCLNPWYYNLRANTYEFSLRFIGVLESKRTRRGRDWYPIWMAPSMWSCCEISNTNWVLGIENKGLWSEYPSSSFKGELHYNSLQYVFCKKGVLKNFTKFARKQVCQSLFFKKETLAQVVSCEFCEIFKRTIFIEHLRWLFL